MLIIGKQISIACAAVLQVVNLVAVVHAPSPYAPHLSVAQGIASPQPLIS